MTTAADILDKFGVQHPPSTAPGRYYTTCPKCSASRSTKAHQEAKCLGVTIDAKGVQFGCNHCDFKGGAFCDPFVATYDYYDENGTLLFQVCRTADKTFPQRRPDGNGGWIWSTKGVRKILLHLPQLIAAIANDHLVVVVEGEKDVLSLERIGIVATCSPGGASEPGKKPKWTKEYSEMLRGADIVVMPDHDLPGYAHADATCHMSAGIAKSVRVLKLADHWPACPKGGDISDWLAAGHEREELDALIENAEPWSGTPTKGEGEGESEGNEADAINKKQTDVLVDLAASAELYHNSADVAYADINVSDHRETHSILSRKFRSWLLRQYYDLTDSVPNDTAAKNAIALLEAKAHFDGAEREVFLRVAGHDGRVYLDLCDAEWRAVEIDAEGWRVVERPPVRFYRRPGMLPLPVPTRGGSIETLRKYLNVKGETESNDEFVLAVSWVLAAMRPDGPYPILEINGEEGTAKTTALRILRSLVDPSTAALRGPPREERDLVVAASNGHVVGYDNLSSLSEWLSDGLARISTGGGFGTRSLYTDDDERLFNDTRPVLLGGINDVAVRGDLASRTVRLQLEPIPDGKRQLEKKFWAEFERDYPGILGALLDAVSHGLRELPNVKLARLPRMADFAEWAVACEGAFWKAGTFMRAYRDNIAGVTRTVVEADLVGAAILRTISGGKTWSGTATELLYKLGMMVGERTMRSKYWPDSAKALGWRLKRLSSPLRRLGIEVSFKRLPERTITIAPPEETADDGTLPF